MRRCNLVFTLLIALTWAGVPMSEARAEDVPASEFSQPSRVVAIGQVVAERELLVNLLRTTELIDENERWIGGDAHLVLLGNFLGGGPDVMGTIELVRRLERQARGAGGMVHTLLGFVETQLMHRDLTVITRDQYAHLATDESQDKLDAFVQRGVEEVLSRFPGAPFPERLERQYLDMVERELHPGAVEFLEQFAPGTELGDWLRSRNAIVRIGDVIYSHGGLSPEYTEFSLKEINDQTRAENAQDTLLIQHDIDGNSPIWYRDLAAKDPMLMGPVIETVLHTTQAKAQAIAQIPRIGPTREGLGRRVFYVESGMRAHQLGALNDQPSALEIAGDEYAMYLDNERIRLGRLLGPPAERKVKPEAPQRPR